MSNWVMSLDNLASSGVIDFDAPAFLLGQNPRYIGNPNLDSLPLENPAYQPHGVKMKDVPPIDSYDKHSDNKDLVHNPAWKKWLFAGVAIVGSALLAATLLAKKGKINLPKFKMPNIKMPNWTNIKTKAANLGQKVFSYIKKPFTYLKSKFGSI